MEVEDRFCRLGWEVVEKVPALGPCWEWSHSKRRGGYGQFRRDGKMRLAHRVAYDLWVGPIALGLDICHRCDNPPCVNPNHLFAGTAKQNMEDRDAKGRMAHNSFPGITHPGHKLTEQEVQEIRLADGTMKELGRAYNVTPQNIWRIKQGISWKTLPWPWQIDVRDL